MNEDYADRRKLIINERSGNLRRRGRKALEGSWGKSFLVVLLSTILLMVPAGIIDILFGTTTYINLNTGQAELFPAYGLNSGVNYIVFRSSIMSSVYILLVAGAITLGVCIYFLNMYRKNNPKVSDIFSGFEFFVKALGLLMYQVLFIILWGIIPIAGVVLAPIAAIRYSQSFYIMIDNPTFSVSKCVNESKYLMSGNKLSYFIMNLSFIGWGLLAIMPLIVVFYGVYKSSSFGSTNAILLLLAMVVAGVGSYFVEAYRTSTNIAFYEILIGNEEADVYTPGEY